MELKDALNDDKMKPLVLQAIDYLLITYCEMLAGCDYGHMAASRTQRSKSDSI